MKGLRIASEYSPETDRATGVRVHKLTAHESINHATYFLQSSLTPDGRTLIFTSYRGGDAQLYAVRPFPDGGIVQLTAGPPIHPFSPAIRPGGREAVLVRAGAVWRLDLQTLEETLVADLRGGQLGEVSLDAAGDWFTAAARRGAEPGLVTGRLDGSKLEWVSFPRTVIHPQFHPLEPDWLEFAGDPAPRMHRVRRDGSGMERLLDHGNDEFVVHETFLGRTGNLVYSVWPHSLWLLDWTTRARRKICDFNAWHLSPNRAGTAILCDTNHPDEGIFLIEAATGERRRVCLSGASNLGSQWKESRYALAEDFARARSEAAGGKLLSWMEASTDTVYGPQWTHPHPSFSPGERLAVFTSDRTGFPQVYAAEIALQAPTSLIA
jgi:hypothetical protein